MNNILSESQFKLTKVKYIVDKSAPYPVGDGDHGSISPNDYVDSGIPYVRVQNLTYSGKFKKNGLVFISHEVHKKNLKSQILPNDILIAKTGTIGKLCLVPNTWSEYNTTSSVGKITLDTTQFKVKYLLYFLQNEYIQNLIKQISYQKSAQPGFNIDDLINFPILKPSLLEQKLISCYLDKKTEQIDRLVEKIQKKIELLKEQRASLINQCVTKGLDPSVEMKDSGVEWIGEIPKHWKVSKIRYERSNEKYSLVDGPFGSDLKSEHYVDNGDVFVIESGFVTKGSFQQTREFKTISKDHFEKIRRSECFEGDIIIAKIGEYYGMSSILPNLGRETVISGNSCRLKISSENNVKFFHSVLLNLRYQGVIQREVNQTGQPFISLGVIDNLNVFVPPLKEQKEIVEYMIETISNIDSVISLTAKKIKLLSEYRQSLISSVVTGKVRVTEDML